VAEKNRRELWFLVTYEKNTGSILAAAFGRGRKIVFKIRAEHFIFAKDFQRHAILEIHPGLLHKGIFFQDLRSLFAFVVLLRDEYRSLVEKQSLRAELLASIPPQRGHRLPDRNLLFLTGRAPTSLGIQENSLNNPQAYLKPEHFQG
jgi:hypothetical protein